MGQWTEWMDYTDCIYLTQGCVHYLEARGYDCLGNRGEIDNQTFWVCAPGGETGPKIKFIQPTFGSIHCNRTLHVILDASDDQTPKSELEVILWIPGGRRDAPTLWYYPEYDPDTYGDEYFHAFIDIYVYQDGAELTLMALAQDEDYNVEFAVPRMFTVCSTIVWDQWMQKGWNSLTLPWGAISCDDSVESVLASIDGHYDAVFSYNAVTDDWSSYVPGEPWNPLDHLETGIQYWVYVNTAGRFFTDTQGPDVEIMSPEDGDEFDEESGQPGVIEIYAYDVETHITDVYVKLYDQTADLYYDGASWQSTDIWLDCYHYDTDYWHYNTSGIWTAGHTYDILAKAYDAAGCYGEDAITISLSGGETYSLTMAVIGNGQALGEGQYAAGDIVNIQAIPDSGNIFQFWSAPAGTFGNEFVASTTFTMPAQDVTVTARFMPEEEFEERSFDHTDLCYNTDGGVGIIYDYWDISAVNDGAVFDFYFYAITQPDRYTMFYDDEVIFESGWVSDWHSYYAGNPLYPEGVQHHWWHPNVVQSTGWTYSSGGLYQGIITKTSGVNQIIIRTEGGEPGTWWYYQLCSQPQ